MTITIELTDEQAKAVRAEADARGLSVEELFRHAVGLGREKRGERSLESLVAACDPSAPASDEDLAWLNAPALGGEI